jgi:hypothetical protein
MALKDKYEQHYQEVAKTFEKIRKHIQKQLEKKFGTLIDIEEKVDNEDILDEETGEFIAESQELIDNIVIEKIDKLYPKANQQLKDFLGFFYMEHFFRKISNEMELEEELEESNNDKEKPKYLN